MGGAVLVKHKWCSTDDGQERCSVLTAHRRYVYLAEREVGIKMEHTLSCNYAKC